ncbi:hypothetical protein QAD02_021546 [Eretmocerus hayati]|uniref:Uncharacterized protein n=1 Tax=Eretmocerus hayati TaxID=131215 RepID=A0ACC2PRX9_9HYME|nr:hypothetical protein QAD02_021546 [Eretmocerus hayati]
MILRAFGDRSRRETACAQEEVPDHTGYQDCEIVVFDIETTGLCLTDEIVQLAAVCGEADFNVYILPRKKFSPEAASVTKMKKVDDKLFVGDAEVEILSARGAFMSFLYFLKSRKKPCILVAHNGFGFDAPRVLKLAGSLHLMKEFKTFVKGFGDTWYMLKDRLPERVQKKLSFSQPDLVKDYLNGDGIDNAHNALADVKMLQNLITKLKINMVTIIINTRSFEFMTDQKSADPSAINCMESLHDEKVTRDIKLRLSKAGLSRLKLEAVCKNGKEAFHMLMSQSVCAKPRITKAKNTMVKLFEALTKKAIDNEDRSEI